MAKSLKPGQKARRSGEFEIIGPRGGDTGKERARTKAKILAPTPKPGQSYILHAKSGRFIIASPVKSANTVTSWSNAFKK